MFGYVNADRSQLSKEDSITYQRYYCGLCQTLKREAGAKGQIFLNYDLTFMAILLSGLYEPESSMKTFRCPIHPLTAHNSFTNEFIDYAAAMDIILSYHNLMDKYLDDNSRVALSLAKGLKKDYERIKLSYPRQTEAVENYISKLSKAELSKEGNIDLVANFTGEMLGVLFNPREDEWSKDLEAVGFYLGKFIYLLDAYEDLSSDEKKGSYNPLIRLKKENPKDFETFIRTNLTCLMAECARSFERLPIVENTEILRNIIYSGVWTKYEYLQIKDKKKLEDIQKELSSDFKEIKK